MPPEGAGFVLIFNLAQITDTCAERVKKESGYTWFLSINVITWEKHFVYHSAKLQPITFVIK